MYERKHTQETFKYENRDLDIYKKRPAFDIISRQDIIKRDQ